MRNVNLVGGFKYKLDGVGTFVRGNVTDFP